MEKCYSDLMDIIMLQMQMSGRDKNATKRKGITHSRSLE